MLRISHVWKVLLIAGCLCGLRVDAWQIQDVSNLAERYADEFTPVSESNQIQLADQVSEALRQLQQSLEQIDEVDQTKWHQTFALDELEQILESDATNLTRLRMIERSFYGLTLGLDVQPLIPLRQALTRYVNFLVVQSTPDLRSEYHRRLAALQELLADPTTQDTVAIAKHVDWLLATGQAPELVNRLQREFHHPCIIVDVNMNYLLPYMNEYQKEISESKFTTNRIVGVPVSGMSHFSAKVVPSLKTHPDRATLRLEIDGLIDSPSNDSRPDPQRAPLIGNVSVALKSSGKTTVHGHKEIYWNGERLVAEPADVQCQTQSSVNNLAISREYRFPKSRIARRVDNQIRKKAREEIQKKSPQANHESAGIAEKQIAEQLDAEVNQMIGKANAEIDEFYREPLESIGLFPRGTSQSGTHAVRLGFRGPNFGGIGAPQALPERPLKGDVEVNMHETVCTSLWAGYLRGRQIDDRDFKNIHRELRGFVPQALRMSGNQSWSVTLNSESPLDVCFRNDRVTFSMKIDSLDIDDTHFTQGVTVTASYQVIPEIVMPRFLRDGDVSIEWHPASGPNPVDSTAREFMTAKFNAFFAKEMYMDGMSAPIGSEWGAASQMRITGCEINDGWWRVVFENYNLNQLN